MKFLIYFIVFCLIFNFPIPGFYNSVALAFLLASILYLRKEQRSANIVLMKTLFKSKQTILIISLYLILILFTFFWAFFHGTNDFSFSKSYLLSFIVVIVTVYVLPLIISKLFCGDEDYLTGITRVLVYLFVIQSVIQILAFVFPSIFEVTSFFKSDVINNRNFHGIRALALTGNPFFSLSSAYGLSFIMFFFLEKKKKHKFPIIIFILLFFGSFFAGRTAFIGLGFGLLYYLLNSIGGVKEFVFSFVRIFITIFCIVIISILTYAFFLPVDIQILVDELLLPYAFEFIYTYQESGSFSTESSDVLNDMYFPISLDTMLWGDGKFMNEDGSYYMHTDAGYMRSVLFFGVFGQVFLVLSQFIMVKKSLFSKNNDYSERVFFCLILIYFSLLHYKGQVFLFVPILQSMIIMFSYNYILKEKVVE